MYASLIHLTYILCYIDPVYKITLSVSNLRKSLEYWNQLLGMNILQQSETSAELAYSDNEVCTYIIHNMYMLTMYVLYNNNSVGLSWYRFLKFLIMLKHLEELHFPVLLNK